MFANPFWNWFWHIFGFVCICLICLPSRYLEKISQRFAVHRPLSVDNLEEMRLSQQAVATVLQENVVEAYNQANFLYKNPKPPNVASLPLLTWQDTARDEGYCLAAAGQNVVVIRTREISRRGNQLNRTVVPKHRNVTAFTIQSTLLSELLLNEWQVRTKIIRAACDPQVDLGRGETSEV